MITDDILRKEIWWVLQELQKEDLARSAPEELIYFEYQNPQTKSSIPSWNDQRLALNILENKHAIKIESNKYAMPMLDSSTAKMMGIKPSGVYLDILLPKFDEIYEEYKNFVTKKETTESSTSVKEVETLNRPYCTTEKGFGYLKFGKQGAKKKIGKADSRPFKFLRATIDLLGVFKSVDAVFTAIWMEKDNQDSRLTNPNTASARKVEIIKNSAIKELQKDDRLGGKIKFEFNQPETQVRAVLVE